MDEKKTLKDHKQIGQELELFFTDDIAPGAPFWLPKGMVIFKQLEKYIRELTENAGYLETSTPIMVKSELFKQSGHWIKFGAHNMYNLALYEDEEIEEFNKNAKSYPINIGETITVSSPPSNYTLKPMNCPESTILYRFRQRSYKELPLRLSEIGRLHRREKSGEVNGLLRVRQITMDDAHIYATEDQILSEINGILAMMITFYKSFGFEYEFRLATRPEQFAGTKENWNRAEKELEQALKSKKLTYTIKDKDGAFYGPKIDVHIKDSLGREWQLATVQLDFHQPEAFKLEYIDEKGERKRPVMIHRAIFGSFERFIGILTEHYQGKFPLWLSPTHIVLIPIADRHAEYAQKVAQQLQNENIRVSVDNRSETLSAKIRTATLQKAPYIGIIGDKEVQNIEPLVSVRGREKDLGQILVSDLLQKIKEEIDKKI